MAVTMDIDNIQVGITHCGMSCGWCFIIAFLSEWGCSKFIQFSWMWIFRLFGMMELRYQLRSSLEYL